MKILAQTKIYELLKAFPQLEDRLIALDPKFKKLKNPILRNSIGRVATLQQAAAIADIPLLQLVNTLRESAGQQPLDSLHE